MAHDATKVLLGNVPSSVKKISCHNADPATYLAGLCVSMANDSGSPTLSLLKSAGMRIGVSLGKDLGDASKTSVCRAGLSVPVRASLKRSTGVVTISNYANLVSGTDDALTIGGTAFTAQAGAATPGDATFQAATSNAATAISLAAQINAHATASTKVYAVVTSSGVVTLYSVVEGAGTGHDVAVSYTDNDTNVGITLSGLSGGKLTGGSDTISDIAYIAKGAKMYVNDFTGKADIAMTGISTITDATYVSEELSGLQVDSSTEVAAVLVDMQGGL